MPWNHRRPQKSYASKWGSKRRSYVGATKGAAIAAIRALPPSGVNRGVQLSEGELKSVDHNGALACNTTGTLLLLNGIARGDEINERNGREVTMRSVELKVQSAVTAGTGIDQIQRHLLVYDRQTNGTALTIAQVLDSVSTVAMKSLENRRRFKILMDRTVVLNATAEPGSMNYYKYYRRIFYPVTFNSGDAGTVADITTGSLYFITLGTVVAGATAGTTTVQGRVRYQDK